MGNQVKIYLAEPDADERTPVGQVFQARQRRLAYQIGAAFGRPAAGDLQGRVALEGIDVAAVLLARFIRRIEPCRRWACVDSRVDGRVFGDAWDALAVGRRGLRGACRTGQGPRAVMAPVMTTSMAA